MSNYIERAKQHLAELSKSIDSETFKSQYESLNHNSESIFLEDFKIEEFYSFIVEFTEASNHKKLNDKGGFYHQLVNRCVTATDDSNSSKNPIRDNISNVSKILFSDRPRKETDESKYKWVFQEVITNRKSRPATSNSYANCSRGNDKYSKAA